MVGNGLGCRLEALQFVTRAETRAELQKDLNHARLELGCRAVPTGPFTAPADPTSNQWRLML